MALGQPLSPVTVTFACSPSRPAPTHPTPSHPAPSLQRVAVHYARNALAGLGALPGQVPLVLGIWGPKASCGTPPCLEFLALFNV